MNLYTIIGSIYFVLLNSSIIVRLPHFSNTPELRARVNAWWVMVTLFSLAIIISKTISIVFFGFMSFMALKEFFTMTPTKPSDRGLIFCAYLTIPLQYYFAANGLYSLFFAFIPIYSFLIIPLCKTIMGDPIDFLRSASALHWGTMMMVFCLSHMALLLSLPQNVAATAGNAGLVLFLVLLTEINDVSQFISGKMFGRRKILPSISPNKTWEGCLGGALVTTTLSALVAHWLTPFTLVQAIIAGLLISASGFLGDAIMSAVKRDIQIKDFGSMLPGHGGILDRVDSLIYTAPIFFYYLYYVCYS